MRFLDTNIFIRYLTRDDEVKAQACLELFQRIDAGEEIVTTSEAVISEIAYVLSSPKLPYRLSHAEVQARLLPLIALRGLRLSRKRLYQHALEIWAGHSFLDFEDALAVAYMAEEGIQEVLSYDTDFDRVSGVSRVEP